MVVVCVATCDTASPSTAAVTVLSSGASTTRHGPAVKPSPAPHELTANLSPLNPVGTDALPSSSLADVATATFAIKDSRTPVFGANNVNDSLAAPRGDATIAIAKHKSEKGVGRRGGHMRAQTAAGDMPPFERTQSRSWRRSGCRAPRTCPSKTPHSRLVPTCHTHGGPTAALSHAPPCAVLHKEGQLPATGPPSFHRPKDAARAPLCRQTHRTFGAVSDQPIPHRTSSTSTSRNIRAAPRVRTRGDEM